MRIKTWLSEYRECMAVIAGGAVASLVITWLIGQALPFAPPPRGWLNAATIFFQIWAVFNLCYAVYNLVRAGRNLAKIDHLTRGDRAKTGRGGPR